MKNILPILAILFASCSKDSNELPAPPSTGAATITVTKATRICTGINCNQVSFKYQVTKPELLNAITFNYGVTVGVPVTSSGTFQTYSTPSTVTGFFELKYKDGKIVRTETKSYL